MHTLVHGYAAIRVSTQIHAHKSVCVLRYTQYILRCMHSDTCLETCTHREEHSDISMDTKVYTQKHTGAHSQEHTQSLVSPVARLEIWDREDHCCHELPVPS